MRRSDRLAPTDAAIERQKLLAKVLGRVLLGIGVVLVLAFGVYTSLRF
jgi:hypothetical protein